MIPRCKKISFVQTGESFYCSVCDYKIVHSEAPETGSFFSTPFGHLWNVEKQKPKDDFEFVIFAVCSECLKKNEEETYEVVQANQDKPHRCPECHTVSDAAELDGRALVGKWYWCGDCQVKWMV